MQDTQRGELNAALQGADQAYRRYANKDMYWAWRFRVLQAHILVLRGSSEDALQLLKQDLPPDLGSTDVAVRQKLVQGLAFEASQKPADAERILDEAADRARSNHPNLLGDVVLARGTLLVNEQKYADAEADFHAALSLSRQQHKPALEAAALGNLGFVAMKQEHYDESVDWDREALQFAQSNGQQGSAPNILGNIGWSYFEMGDFDDALDFYTQAEEASSRAGLASDRAYWLSSIGSVYYVQHDYESAEATMQRALELARTLNNKETITQCLNNLSQIALETGRISVAEQYNQEATEIENAGQDHLGILYSLVAAGRIQASRHSYANAEQDFQNVIRDTGTETSLRWEAEARLAKVYADAALPADAEREFRQAIRTIEAARSSVKAEAFRLSFLSSAISFYSDYIDFLISQNRPADALEVAELSRAHTLTNGQGISSAGFSSVIRGFQPSQTARRLHSIILSYWLGPQKSYLWGITPNRVALFTLPPASQIDSLVRAYRQDLVGPRDVLEMNDENGRKLYSLLVTPAQGLIPKGSSVTILPDGSLYDLNFETLLVPAPRLHYWIDDVVLENANSLLPLAASVSQPQSRLKTLLLIGNPISPSALYPDLPQASVEMEQIEKHFAQPNRKVLSSAQATADAYLHSDPGQFTYIHFVAHGMASRSSPLDSAVVLSREGDAYKLYAREIMKQPLHADLVTISACHGAEGRTYSGEGLVGLAWAFLRAGAHGVIAALWEVNDNSTSEMMGQLYGEITKGIAPDIALRDAKLAFLHSNTVYRKPFYWAAFQIYRGS